MNWDSENIQLTSILLKYVFNLFFWHSAPSAVSETHPPFSRQQLHVRILKTCVQKLFKNLSVIVCWQDSLSPVKGSLILFCWFSYSPLNNFSRIWKHKKNLFQEYLPVFFRLRCFFRFFFQTSGLSCSVL